MIKDFLRQTLTGLKALLVLTVLLGIGYPATVWAVGQVAFHDQASGQIVGDKGSRLIGQNFAVKDDAWFHSRPSANDYDTLASGPSNLGPSNPDLLAAIKERQQKIALVEGVDVDDIPADAATASGSGLDPYISPAYASLQVDRVARARGMSVGAVRKAVVDNTHGRQLGFLGQPRVNVFELNLALESAVKGASGAD